MKKDFLKRTLSIGLSAAMLLSTNVSAASVSLGMTASDFGDATSSGQSLEVSNTMINGTIQLSVPTENAMTLALDPLEVAGKGQVVSSDYLIFNKSNVPVRLALDLSVTPSASTSLRAAKIQVNGGVGSGNPDVLTKQAYIEFVPLKNITYKSPATTGLVADVNKIEYDTTTANLVAVGTNANTSKAKVDFYLAKARYQDSGTITGTPSSTDWVTGTNTVDPDGNNYSFYRATQTTGVAGFTFKGNLNAYAAFENDDITTSVVYVVDSMKGTDYTAPTAALGLNVKSKAIVNNAPALYNINVKPGSAISMPYSLGTGTSTILPAKVGAITTLSIKVGNTVATAAELKTALGGTADDEITLDATNTALKFGKNVITKLVGMNATSFDVTMMMDDVEYTATVTITR